MKHLQREKPSYSGIYLQCLGRSRIAEIVARIAKILHGRRGRYIFAVAARRINVFEHYLLARSRNEKMRLRRDYQRERLERCRDGDLGIDKEQPAALYLAEIINLALGRDRPDDVCCITRSKLLIVTSVPANPAKLPVGAEAPPVMAA